MAKIALVASSGGHLYELFSLKNFYRPRSRFWVSFDTEDARYLLCDERVFWAYHPTNRSIKNFFRNLWLALRILRRERPDVLISTGAGVGVSFIYAARLLGIRTVYLESLTRITNLSLSGRLVYPLVDLFLVQWEHLTLTYPRVVFRGTVV
ncbi:MAG: PssD/Cps14F family polysaccharide biosynthesis glycosyltransferase [PVC group bacterium]